MAVEITGCKELEEMLANLDVQDAIKTSLYAGAEVVAAELTNMIPVNETGGGLLRDGMLKSDVIIQRRKFRQSGEPYCAVTFGKMTRYVAMLVEYGHRLVRGGYNKQNKVTGKNRGPGRVIGTVPEKAYIRKSEEVSKAACLEAINATFLVEMEKLTGNK